MGKTGGGRGTNGYQVKGRSVMRAGSDGRHAESDVTLSTPIRRPTGLVGSDIELLLSELDAAMTAAGIVGQIELVGGAALALAHYDRLSTTDVDGSIHPAPEITEIAAGIAKHHGLKTDWLNNAAQGFFPPGDTGEEAEVVLQGESLTVTVAGPRTLLAMKLRAARPAKDADDIAVLLRACNVTSLDGAKAVLDDAYGGEEGLTVRGERIVIAALNTHTIVLADGEELVLDAVNESDLPATCGQWVLRLDRRCELGRGHDGDCR
ncbi:MAG: hypothetical protein H6519_01845 [Microthrixaceae bacterium]|nr:hypothetical protein [Acidimicrobiales bacterium]MCB9403157.1 hypothetical protein [Microthrixaceae bacterium]